MPKISSTLLLLGAILLPSSAVLLPSGAVLLPSGALAQATPIRELLKLSCTGDYLEHCSMHPPGGPEVEACFRENIRKLSPDCAQAIRTYQRQKKSGR